MPITINRNGAFTFVKGEDAIIHWTIRTDPTGTTPEDITGWTFAFKVKRKDSDPDPSLITATPVIIDPLLGQVDVTIPSAQLATLKGDYKYSLWRTNIGAQACLSRGFFSVSDTVQN